MHARRLHARCTHANKWINTKGKSILVARALPRIFRLQDQTMPPVQKKPAVRKKPASSGSTGKTNWDNKNRQRTAARAWLKLGLQTTVATQTDITEPSPIYLPANAWCGTTPPPLPLNPVSPPWPPLIWRESPPPILPAALTASVQAELAALQAQVARAPAVPGLPLGVHPPAILPAALIAAVQLPPPFLAQPPPAQARAVPRLPPCLAQPLPARARAVPRVPRSWS